MRCEFENQLAKMENDNVRPKKNYLLNNGLRMFLEIKISLVN